MSHISEITIDCSDLIALKIAAAALGLEFMEGQTTYRWYGRSIRDYPLPTGFTEEDLGKCEHAIGIPDNAQAYQIGVVRRRDGKPGYTLLWDFWNGGYGLEERIGQGGGKLKQRYGVAVAQRHAAANGYSCKIQQKLDGSMVVTLNK